MPGNLSGVLRYAVWICLVTACGRLGFAPTTDAADSTRDSDAADAQTALGPALSIAIGDGAACAVLEDRSLWCWGDLRFGTLPAGVFASARATGFTAPAQVGTASDWSEVALGDRHGCAIKVDGSLWCWGTNDRGQVGTGGALTDVPTQLATVEAWKHVAATGSTSCAISMANGVWCWGSNDTGQYGDGSMNSATQPQAIAALVNVEQLVLGAAHACAVMNTDQLFCWGSNTDAEIGNGTPGAPALSPFPVPGTWRTVSVGFYATSAIASDGTLWAWGHGISNTPMQHDARTDWVATSTPYTGFCGISSTGEMWCKGNNGSGELGNGTNQELVTMTRVGVGETFTSVVHDTTWGALGHQDTGCANRSDGVVCAGAGWRGQLGDGDVARFSRAARKVPGGPWLDVQVASRISCARDSANLVSCWGSDPLNTRSASTDPRAISTEAFSDFSASDVLCGVNTSGGVWAMGYVPTSNTTGVFALPYELDPSSATTVSCASSRGAMRRADGTLWAWGVNDLGQVGDTTTTFRATPVQIAPSVAAVDAGYTHACAIDSAGDVLCWGTNSQGQLGDNTTTDRSVPTPVVAAGPWSKVSASTDFGLHTCAIHSTGALWCWGWDIEGAVGTASPAAFEPVPTLVSSASWTDVDTANRATCAVRADGTLWCWGSNPGGARDGTHGIDGGDGPAIDLPAQVGTDTDWSTVALAFDHGCARKTNGDVWCWGSNGSGQLGSPSWAPDFRPVVR